MFTGIIEELGTIKKITRGSEYYALSIGASKVLENTQVGDSIAVNGICLTITNMNKNVMNVDVMPETISKTNLEKLKIGNRVNLERAMTLSSRMGGHMVSGHIDGVGAIKKKSRQHNALIIEIETPEAITKFLINRGSIAVDGISLTVMDYGINVVVISIIPHTAAMTTLGFKDRGDTVNLESDLIGKYVHKFISDITTANTANKALLDGSKETKNAGNKGITIDKLRDLGFT